MDNATKLDVINSVLTNITQTTDTSGSQGLTVTGLNVYQIFPKKIYYPMSARTNYSGSDPVIMGARTDLNCSLSNFTIGPVRDFTIQYLVSAQSLKKVDIDYIDSSGDLKSIGGFFLNSSATSVTSIRNINRIVWNASGGDTVNIPFTVDLASRPASGSQVYHNSINPSNSGSAIITIPNGYIGIISNIGIYANPVGAYNVTMHVRDRNNNTIYKRYLLSSSTIENRYNSLGSFNYPLYPGDSVFFVADGSTIEQFAHALVTLTAI